MTGIWISQWLLIAGLALALLHFMRNDSGFEKILAAELLALMVLSLAVVTGVRANFDYALELTLVWAIVAFVGTVTFAINAGGQK